MQATANLIGERIAGQQEVQVIISGKILEQRIMNMMPFLLICYIELGNKGFFDALYHNLSGIIIMTGCLVVYLAAFIWSKRLCKKI